MSEHDSLDLRALGALLRQMQGELRALGVKFDLLARGRERDVAAFGTRDDMRDIVDVLAERLIDVDQRITGQLVDVDQRISNLAEQMASHGKMLGEILDRLPPR